MIRLQYEGQGIGLKGNFGLYALADKVQCTVQEEMVHKNKLLYQYVQKGARNRLAQTHKWCK